MTAGNITRRGKASWRLKFEGERDPATGKRNIQYLTVRGSKAEAKLRLAEMVAAVGGGAYVEPNKVTVAELVAERIALWRTTRAISAKTAERREQLLRGQIARIGSIPVQKLWTVDLERWHAALIAAGLAGRTIREAHSLLAQSLDAAEKHKVVTRNVARVQRPPKFDHEEIQIIPAEEIEPALTKLAGSAFHAPVIVALYTGIRRGEQLALTWADVNLDARTLDVKRALEETKADGIVTKVPKTKAGVRTVALPQNVVEALREHRRQQLELRMALGAGRMPDDALVFPTVKGGYWSPRNFSTAWSRVVQRLGLPKITWHAWRHTHASMLIDARVDIATIAKRLGHANPAITLTTYAHRFKRDDRAAADAIDALAR